MRISIYATLALLVSTATAGVDYKAARSLQGRMGGTVANQKIAAVWAPDGSALYYRRGGKILRVDTRNGESTTAIESSLLKPFFQGLQPRILRFEIDQNGDFVCLAAAKKQVHIFRVSSGKVTELEPEADPFALVPRKAGKRERSGMGHGSTRIYFINNSPEPADIHWVDFSGVHQKMITLEPGKTYAQSTTAGHVFTAGKLAFTATKKPAIAYIAAALPKSIIVQVSKEWKATFKNHNLFADGTQLTFDGSEDWKYCGPTYRSPDGRYLVAMRVKTGTNRHIDLVEAAPKDQLQPRTRSIYYPKAGDTLNVRKPHLFNLKTGNEIPLDDALFSNPWSLIGFYWNPDGKQFFFIYNERGHQILRVLSIEASTGKVVSVVEESSPTFINYSQKRYLTYIDETDDAIWMSERSGWNHLYLVDRKAGTTTPITTGEWVVRDVDHIDAEKRQIWFRAAGIHPDQDPYYIHHARINFDGTDLVLLTEGNGTHDLGFSPDRRFYTDTWSRVDQPPVHELRRSSDGKKVADLGKADAAKLLAIHPHLPESFVAKGRDGTTDIYGVIFRPSHFDPERKYPVVERIYAGPHDYFVPKEFSAYHGAQRLAELGFIVVQIDGMGTNWRSKRFHDVCWKNLKDSGFPDRIAWMKAAAKKYPCMDLSRVGIYGGSAGGQSAMRAVLDYPEFYKAAASDCGCHDNRMDKIWWNEAWMGWPVDESYAENSNMLDAHKLGGKLLLTVGMLDRNVDPSSTLQVVDALIKADKDFEFIAFPSLGHGAGESPYGQRRREEFFVRHLLGL